jgi:hypothetical protein
LTGALLLAGFGVEDAGEQHETNKALEEASTIVLPSFKDLKHNKQAVALLEKSRFLSQGRRSATKPGLSLLTTEEGEEKPELETQQVVVISYPENRLAARRSLTVRHNTYRPSTHESFDLHTTRVGK